MWAPTPSPSETIHDNYSASVTALAIRFVLNGLCIASGLFTIVTFKTFPWLNRFPRNLYMYFTMANVLECSMDFFALCLPRVSQFDCERATMFFVADFGAEVSEFLWIMCISIAIYFELKSVERRMKPHSLECGADIEKLRKDQEDYMTFKRRSYYVYHFICWVYPLALCLWGESQLFQPGHCYKYSGVMISLQPNGDIAEAHIAVLASLIASFVVSVALLILVIANLANVMEALDLNPGGPQGTIDPNSIIPSHVYVGMGIVFGMTRVLSIVKVVYDVKRLQPSNEEEYRNIEMLYVVGSLVSPIQGLLFFAWFATKFHYAKLWSYKWETRDPSLVTEALLGIF